jgi:hypothetical protein
VRKPRLPGRANKHPVRRGLGPKQAKALLRLLIKDLRINGRREILPTYRVLNDAVCALPSSVGAAGIEPATPRV